MIVAFVAPLAAQEGPDGLNVQPGKDNVLVNSLVGSWVLDAELNKRLGKRGKRGK